MGVLYDLSFGHLVTYVVLVEAAALVAYLWLYRSRIPIRPGEGRGYRLVILGALLMECTADCATDQGEDALVYERYQDD
jgi:hypothetical protein